MKDFSENYKGLLVYQVGSNFKIKYVLVGNIIPELIVGSKDLSVLFLQFLKVGKKTYLHCTPTDEPHRYMFGGNFVYTSDSRFPNDYPIPIHDREE